MTRDESENEYARGLSPREAERAERAEAEQAQDRAYWAWLDAITEDLSE